MPERFDILKRRDERVRKRRIDAQMAFLQKRLTADIAALVGRDPCIITPQWQVGSHHDLHRGPEDEALRLLQ